MCSPEIPVEPREEGGVGCAGCPTSCTQCIPPFSFPDPFPLTTSLQPPLSDSLGSDCQHGESQGLPDLQKTFSVAIVSYALALTKNLRANYRLDSFASRSECVGSLLLPPSVNQSWGWGGKLCPAMYDLSSNVYGTPMVCQPLTSDPEKPG